MIDVFILILYLLLNISLFVIDYYFIFIGLYLFIIILLFSFKICFSKYLLFIFKSIIFFLFIFVCNIIFSDIYNSILVIIRLFLIINMSYIMAYYFNYSRISKSFYYLLYPLKVFRIDIKRVALIISISLSFINVLMDECEIIKLSLKSMGFEFNIKNVLTKPHVFIVSFINGLLDRVDDMDYYLMMSGFN